MGGGKTKTYRDIQSNQVYDQDDNLYASELVRMFASMGGIYPVEYTRSMIDSSRKYFSLKYLERLGVTATVRAVYDSIGEPEIARHVITHEGINPVKLVVYYTAYNDIDGEDFILKPFRVKSWFESEFRTDTSMKRVFSEEFEFRVDDDPESSFACSGKFDPYPYTFTPKHIHGALFGKTDDRVVIETETYLYYETGSDTGYMIAEPLTMAGTTGVLMDEFEKTPDGWNPTGNQVWQTIPHDGRTIMAIKYSYRMDEDCVIPGYLGRPMVNPDGWGHGFFVSFREDIMRSADGMQVMILPIRDNFNFVKDDKYVNLLLNSYGFKQDDLKENLDDPDLKAALLTYSSDLDEFHPVIRRDLEVMYNSKYGVNDVRIMTDEYDIGYSVGKTECDYTYEQCNEEGRYIEKISFDGAMFDITTKHLYMVPIDNLQELSFTDRYEFLKRDMCLWANSEVTVRLKWYQTGFFKFVFTIVSIGFALFTGGATAAAWAAAGMVVGKMAVQLFGEEIGMIVGILFGLMAPGGSLSLKMDTGTLVDAIMDNWFDIISGSTKLAAENITRRQAQTMMADIAEYREETEAMQEELDQIHGHYLYIPLSGYSAYYDNLYNGHMKIYDNSAYDPLSALQRSVTLGA